MPSTMSPAAGEASVLSDEAYAPVVALVPQVDVGTHWSPKLVNVNAERPSGAVSKLPASGCTPSASTA